MEGAFFVAETCEIDFVEADLFFVLVRCDAPTTAGTASSRFSSCDVLGNLADKTTMVFAF
jgi:hypothetical protein